MADNLSIVLTAIFGLISSFMAYLAYLLNKQTRTDNFAKSFNELHSQFWNDNDFVEVRSWLANDFGYEQIKPTLIKKNIKDDSLTLTEYTILEKLDKFMNFMVRAEEVGFQLAKKGLWEKLNFKHWIIRSKERTELWEYYTLHYKTLPSIS